MKHEAWLRLAALAAGVAVLTLTAGCADGGGDDEWKPVPSGAQEKKLLKVVYSSEAAFYNDYGNLFLTKYPNAEFQVLALSETRGEGDAIDNYRKVIEERQPDVLLLDENQYEALAREGRLLDLEAPIRDSGFDAENLLPGVVDLLKERGGGRLYGLANTFESKALYYNKRLFDRYGVSYPQEGMSWDEILQLAKKFASGEKGKDKVYGLSQSMIATNPFALVMDIAESRRLAFLNPEGTALKLDSEEWANAFAQAVEGYRDGSLPLPSSPFGNGNMTVSLGGGSFMEGKAAMAIDDLLTMQLLDTMKPANTGSGNGPRDFPWGIATMPADPRDPGATTAFSLPEIYAVGAETGEKALAWEFVRYIHSEEFMRLKAKSSAKLLARKGFERDAKGRDLSAFYALRPDPSFRRPMVPKGFSESFRKLAEEETRAAVSGAKTNEEAWASLTARAQQAFDEAILSKEKEPLDVAGTNAMVSVG